MPGYVILSIMLTPPKEIQDVLDKHDKITDGSKLSHIQDDLRGAVSKDQVEEQNHDAWWAERAAFSFILLPKSGKSCWNTVYAPQLSEEYEDGTSFRSPDISEATNDTIEYWKKRATQTQNPSMSSRYADLVWDFCKHVSGEKPQRDFAIIAISGYLASINSHTEDYSRNINSSLERSIHLSLSVNEHSLAIKSIDTAIYYILKNPSIGNFCFLFESVLLHKNRRTISTNAHPAFIKAIEFFNSYTDPGGNDISPFGGESLGNLIAEYYKQIREPEKTIETYRKIAELFERRANLGDAFSGLHFRHIAEKYYGLAKDKKNVFRMRKESADMAVDAKSELRKISHEYEISQEEIATFQKEFTDKGPTSGLILWINYFIPNVKSITEEKLKLDAEFPLQALLGSTIIGKQGLVAQIDDTRGDPEGSTIWEISKRFQLNTLWMNWGLSALLENGLDANSIVRFIHTSPLFDQNCQPMITAGVSLYFEGKHLESIHILIPQIERALRNSLSPLGISPIKPHRSGKGINQFRNMNDILTDNDVRGLLTPDVCLYLLAVLAHPKGLNARNEICHGIWEIDSFNKGMNQRILHCILTIAMIRYSNEAQPD